MIEFITKPFAALIGATFLLLQNIFHNHGVSLILLSVIVNIVLVPLYHIAEKIQQKEKIIQNQMKPKIDEFKSVYKGYERQLYIDHVHRMFNYHPLFALKGLLSLLIQIPFFIGAYAFLVNYSGFEGSSFLFLNDLSAPDALISFSETTINLLPFVMTGINLWSGYVYAKEGLASEKITILFSALFFLVLLYNAPSSLLLYWTFNNIFSLIKNLIYKIIGNKTLLEKSVTT